MTTTLDDLRRARKTLRKQSQPACIYECDNGRGDGGRMYCVAYLSAMCWVLEQCGGDVRIVEYN